MNKLLIAILIAGSISIAHAQAVDAVKESGKAIGQGAKEGADKAKAATSSGSTKAVNKAKAQGHKASTHYHRSKAKTAAKKAVE